MSSTNVWENREDNYLLFIKTCLETVGLTPFPPDKTWQKLSRNYHDYDNHLKLFYREN